MIKILSLVLVVVWLEGVVERIIFNIENGYMYIFVNDNVGCVD